MIQAIFETASVSLSSSKIRFVFEEAFKLMFVFGKYTSYSFTTVETAAHFFFNVGYNLLMSTIVFQLYSCFQEFLVGVEKLFLVAHRVLSKAFSLARCSAIPAPTYFSYFSVLAGSLTCILRSHRL